MKEKWHRAKYVLLAMICLNLLSDPMILYGQEVNDSNIHNVERQVEGQVEGEQEEESNKRAQGEQKHSSGDDKQQESDLLQVYLSLAALFGIGSLTAVLSSILYKIYLSKKVVSLPVLYYGKKEEETYE